MCVHTVNKTNLCGNRPLPPCKNLDRTYKIYLLIGYSLPPMLIFPRVNFKQHFVSNGPSGCIGASHPSGWVTASSFLMFVQHFNNT